VTAAPRPPSAAPTIEVTNVLHDPEVAAVGLLVEQVTEADGTRPLSEHVMLHLRHGGDSRSRHVLAWQGDELVGYAHMDVTDPVDGPSAEVAVPPRHRGHGIGKALVERIRSESPDGRVRLWAHGEHAAAGALATSLGYTRSRVLWQMRRTLTAGVTPPVLPTGYRLRTFVPGQDDDAWIQLNAEAFADHPEQGGWTTTDLHHRLEEPWFDAGGFFLAERIDGETPRLAGFHWTKVHGGRVVHDHDGHGTHTHPGHGHDPIGEVYVIGVSHQDEGQGLGRALLLQGLCHLRGLGLADAMLYVEADNDAAIGLYTSIGFRHWDTDVMYAAPRRP
jgi:mycothiol synthase